MKICPEIMEIEKKTFVSDNTNTQELGMNNNTFSNNDSLKMYPEIKPFSCKYCEKSFPQVHEVKEHIKIHSSTSEVENIETLSENLEVKNKNQSKIPLRRKYKLVQGLLSKGMLKNKKVTVTKMLQI